MNHIPTFDEFISESSSIVNESVYLDSNGSLTGAKSGFKEVGRKIVYLSDDDSDEEIISTYLFGYYLKKDFIAVMVTCATFNPGMETSSMSIISNIDVDTEAEAISKCKQFMKGFRVK